VQSPPLLNLPSTGKNVCEAARLRILDQNNFRKLRKQQRFQRTKQKKLDAKKMEQTFLHVKFIKAFA
jgi:hypothetical protein